MSVPLGGLNPDRQGVARHVGGIAPDTGHRARLPDSAGSVAGLVFQRVLRDLRVRWSVGSTGPNPARCPRGALMSCVRRRTRH